MMRSDYCPVANEPCQCMCLDGCRIKNNSRKPLTDDLYNELLFAVGKKYPGETRHETALRYIKQAETGSNESAKTAHGIWCQE